MSPASLSCRCGKVRLLLADERMRARTECFCADCRQRGLISAARSPANAVPPEVASFDRGVDLYYFSNALIVDEKTRELIRFSKLRPDANNTTCMSACCGTLLCGIHPVYGGTTISVNADSCRVSVPSVLPNQLVIFGCDAPADKWAARTARADVPMVHSSPEGAAAAAMQAFLAAVTTPVEERHKGPGVATFEELCGGRFILDNSFYDESRAAVPRPANTSTEKARM